MHTRTKARTSEIPDNFSFYEDMGVQDSILDEVLAGLSGCPKRLPSSLFYDASGAQLFELICRAPEYYVPRLETSILGSHAAELGPLLRERTIIEYGAGEMSKIRLLIEAAEPRRYVALDVAGAQLMRQGILLARDHPHMLVEAIHADYRAVDLNRWLANDDASRVFFFPGSSIGNFEPDEVETFLGDVARLVGPGGLVILGVDLLKRSERLNRAYNDAMGYTARFNLNLLQRINRELGADFCIVHFEHEAFFNEGMSRIEMHLRSRVDQHVNVGHRRFEFCAGETIHTENSYKYSPELMFAIAERAGFIDSSEWTDEGEEFGVFVLKA